ncbi:MAG: HAMP domain-containing sensor histidine kinase, partial [Ginsengibacter sp.]
MKKIFPAITILVFISALGIIYFQYLWIRQSLQDREYQFEETMNMVTYNTAQALTEVKGKMSPFDNHRNNDLLIPLNVFPFTVAHRFSRDEVRDLINKSLDKNGLKNVNFEFAITTTSMIGDDLQSRNFFNAYNDSLNNKSFILPIDAPTGSAIEGLSPQELLVIVVPHVQNILWKQMSWMVFGVILFTCIIFTAFFITIRALINQKKLSEIKSDFINNMTHEFKTPLATISLAVDALKNEKVINDRSKMDYFSGIIKDENKRMNKQVETILQAALLDKQEVQLNLKEHHAHSLIQAALNNIQLPLAAKEGQLIVKLDATRDCIMADDVHFTNIINNLHDNAVKYSNDGVNITLSTCNI